MTVGFSSTKLSSVWFLIKRWWRSFSWKTKYLPYYGHY